MNEPTTTKPATTNGPKPPATTSHAKADRKPPERRVRSEVEAATSKVMNLVGRLSPGDQRKVMAAVGALVAKAED